MLSSLTIMNAKKQLMDNKSKKMKKSDASDLKELSKNREVPIEMSDLSDFPSSQECFSVGWDWSGQVQKNKKPTIRVIERPVDRISDDSKLLKCHRPRRLVRKYDPDMFDASVFADELRSLASDLKPVPESNSPVTSPPHSSFKRRNDVLSTPTSTKVPSCTSSKSHNLAENVENANTVAEKSHQNLMKNGGDGKESLNDLLNDSLGADLLKLSQDLEQDFHQKECTTPNLQDIQNVSSSKRRNRLSLSSKKDDCVVQRNVCRRINDIYDKNLSLSKTHNDETKCNAAKGQGKKHNHQNNNNVSLNIDFDEIDAATLQTIDELEEKEMVKSRELISKNIKPVTTATHTISQSILTLEEDDEAFNSPDLLDMIDKWEKTATQEAKDVVNSKESLQNVPQVKERNVCKTSNILDFCDKQHELASKNLDRKQRDSLKIQSSSRKKTLSVAGGSFKCTAEEIEKKRQEARKRLQLKKK